MNTLAFIALVAIAEIAVVWLAYALGHETGWLDGWDAGRK